MQLARGSEPCRMEDDDTLDLDLLTSFSALMLAVQSAIALKEARILSGDRATDMARIMAEYAAEIDRVASVGGKLPPKFATSLSILAKQFSEVVIPPDQ